MGLYANFENGCGGGTADPRGVQIAVFAKAGGTPPFQNFQTMALTSKAILQPLAIGLCFSIAPGFSIAQTQTQPPPSRLEVVVVEGEGATNRIRRKAETLPTVRVEDGEHRALSGAVVMFTLPTEGATGDFNGEKTVVMTTDADGIAKVKSLRLNAVPGKVPIHVAASYRGVTARSVINQVTVVPAGEKAGKAERSGGHGALIAVLVCLGAAGGGGAAYALSQKKQGSSAAQPPTAGPTAIGVSVGTGSIAGGH